MRWEDLTALSAAQVAALNALADFGALVRSTPPAQVDALVPTRTYSNAKAGQAGIKDLQDLIGLTQQGISATLSYYRRKAVTDYDAANP
jgi:hypothetical protein